MFKVNDYVVYKRNVIKIKDIINKNMYVLSPIDDNSLVIKIPITDNNLRSIITKKECDELIKSIPNIDVITSDDKFLENEYKKLLNTGKLEDLVKIIKTTYLRNNKRIENHKKIGEKDENYFEKCEKLLYNELSIVLNMSFLDTKNYVKSKVENLLDK